MTPTRNDVAPKVNACDSRTTVINRQKNKRLKLCVYSTSIDKIKDLNALRNEIPGIACNSQEARVLAALTRFSISTFEASRHLDVYDPRARIMSLRNKGHNILTSWALVHTECGRLHRVGIYTLQRSETSHASHWSA